MKKRTESQLVTACLQYLQCLENLGNIAWYTRLNSGMAKLNKRTIRLCRAGTPDIVFLTKGGTCVWVECKSEKGKLSQEQARFCDTAEGFDGHYYIVARSTDDIAEFFCNDK